MAKDNPNPTDVPTKINPTLDPIIVSERLSPLLLLTQTTVATDATAAATQSRRPAPNQTPLRLLGLFCAGNLT
jgi:hypothetical protein